MRQLVRVSRFLPLALLVALPAAGQDFNVDFGDRAGQPGAAFGGAAGQPGTWNLADMGTTPLVGLNGAATDVDLTLDTLADGEAPSTGTGDTASLLDDHFFDCVDPDEWSVTFDGLENGVYSVVVYAPSHPAVGSGTIAPSGTDAVLPEVPGSGEPLVEGQNWARVFATVDDGTLELRGGSGGFNCVGLAGLQLSLTVSGPPPVLCSVETCVENATSLCLEDGRFRVNADFDPPNDGDDDLEPARAVRLTDDSGYFWFFDAANIEVVAKVLGACPVNDHFWVFAGGLTNVQTVLRVCDTETGIEKPYVNPQSTAFQPIQDTAAFATCP